VSLVVFDLSLVLSVHDSGANRLVYILRENSNCTEELNWILGYPQRFGFLIRITDHIKQLSMSRIQI
jgi:hypothetical protein